MWLFLINGVFFLTLGLGLLFWVNQRKRTDIQYKGITVAYFGCITIANAPLFLGGLIPLLFNDNGASFAFFTSMFWQGMGWSLLLVTPLYVLGLLAGFLFQVFHSKLYGILCLAVVFGWALVYGIS